MSVCEGDNDAIADAGDGADCEGKIGVIGDDGGGDKASVVLTLRKARLEGNT